MKFKSIIEESWRFTLKIKRRVKMFERADELSFLI